MKIFYFNNTFSKELYDKMYNLIINLELGYTPYEIFKEYFLKFDEDFDNLKIGEPQFLEFLAYIESFKKSYGLDYKEILSNMEIIYDNTFFILNEDIYWYNQNGQGFEKIDIYSQEIFFSTSRTNFNSPFFSILSALSKTNKNIKIITINKQDGNSGNNDKLSVLQKIYIKRSSFFDFVIVPLFQNKTKENVVILLEFISSNINNKIIVKNNISQGGYGVKAMDITNIKDIDSIIDKYFFYGYGKDASYITEYVDIHREYRLYYRYDKKNSQIYSIKGRKNIFKGSPFEEYSYRINENVIAKWEYIHLTNYSAIKDNYGEYIESLIELAGFDGGVLEFMIDKDGKFHFCEINPLGATLMFKGDDEENMFNYYVDIWNDLHNNYS